MFACATIDLRVLIANCASFPPMPTSQESPQAPARRWVKTDATQQRILDAATEAFGERGFSAATMAEVVARSGTSIGSIYHHFGGKNELFLGIFERMRIDVEHRIDETVKPGGAAGRPQTFRTHARAYLEAIWANRRAALVVASDDAPAGFAGARRASMLSSFRRWMSVLELDQTPSGQLLNRLLVAVLIESALMVTSCEDPTDAAPIIDATIECIERLSR